MVPRAVLISLACSLLSAPSHAASLRAGQKAAPAKRKSQHLSSSEVPGPNTSKYFASQAPLTEPEIPSMFVAIMTQRDRPVLERNAIRELWNSVNANSGRICYRFIVCKRDPGKLSTDSLSGKILLEQSLVAEQTAYGDLLLLDCEEGYAEGMLTKKVIATMDAYRNAASRPDAWCLDRALFMKTDDDTFVAGQHFRFNLASAAALTGTSHMYAGVYSPEAPVVRNDTSHWFEPQKLWPNSTYPPAMYGGPGYILGKSIVREMIDQKVTQKFVLWNEDRAVGVWISLLEQKGVQVNWTRLPGTNGFSWDFPVKNGTWGAYPYALQHHLSRACIVCLAMFERAKNPNVSIHSCFQLDPIPEKWTWVSSKQLATGEW